MMIFKNNSKFIIDINQRNFVGPAEILHFPLCSVLNLTFIIECDILTSCLVYLSNKMHQFQSKPIKRNLSFDCKVQDPDLLN